MTCNEMESQALDQAFLTILELFHRKEQQVKALQGENQMLKDKLTYLLNEKHASAQARPNVKRYTAENSTIDTNKTVLHPAYSTIDVKEKEKSSIKSEQQAGIICTTSIDSSHYMTNENFHIRDKELVNEQSSEVEMSQQNITKPFMTTDNSSMPEKSPTGKKLTLTQSNSSCVILPSYNRSYDEKPQYVSRRVAPIPTHSASPNPIMSGSDSSQSRNKVKLFLNEVKEKLQAKDFKEFINYIRILTDKSQKCERKDIFERVKNLFGTRYQDYYLKFEDILSIKR